MDMLQKINDYRRQALEHFQLYQKFKKEAENADKSDIGVSREKAIFSLRKKGEFNKKAVMCIVRMHHATHRNINIMDLHLLQVNEAAKCVDGFLDHHINRLRLLVDQGKTKDLYVITGRGRHSHDGVAKIKLHTVERFDKRQLKSTEVNPGYLKVTICKESLLSTELT